MCEREAPDSIARRCLHFNYIILNITKAKLLTKRRGQTAMADVVRHRLDVVW